MAKQQDKPEFIGQHGRRLRTIHVDGVEMRPKDAMWVFYNPKGVPYSATSSDLATLDSVAAAARKHWFGGSEAIEKLNAGYRVKLMPATAFYKDVAAKMDPTAK